MKTIAKFYQNIEAAPTAKASAKSLRRNMTDEELILWSELKQLRRSRGLAFRRQAPIGKYVADFFCRKAMLIVEVDGDHHSSGLQSRHDSRRDTWMASQGYKVLRYWNSDIRSDLNTVVNQVINVAEKRVSNGD